MCVNPGRLVKGVSTGSYAKIVFGEQQQQQSKPPPPPPPSEKVAISSAAVSELAEMYASVEPAVAAKPPPPTIAQTQTQNVASSKMKWNVTFHKI